MFVHSLTLENWRSHKATEFKFGALNLIRGANNSGKSSVAAAIDFLLTGRCLWTQEAGQGGDRLITTGARQSTISGGIGSPAAVNMTLHRFRTMAGGSLVAKMNGREYAGRQVEELFDKKGWTKAALSCILRGGRFIELSASDQKELLADILRPEPVVTPAEIRQAMEVCFGGFECEQVDLEGLRELEERAIKLRAECTGALRELGDPGEAPTKPKGTSEQVRSKLDSLREEQGELRRAKEKLENDWAEKSKRHRELPKLIAFWNDKILSEDTEKRNLATIDQETEIRAAQNSLATVEGLIDFHGKALVSLEAHPGVCPTCKQNWDVSAQLEVEKNLLTGLRQKHSEVRSFLEGCADVGDAKVRLAAHRNAIVEKAKLEKELKESKVPDAPDTKKVKELSGQIDTLEERIKKGQSILASTAADEERISQHKALCDRRGQVESKRTAADTLAKWAGPNGAQAQMTAGKLPAFVAQINQVLEAFGYDCQIELEPYRLLAGRRVDGNARLELDSLSESERWRFSLAFQAALARTTGVNCIVLDRADVLVGANRSALLKAILGLGLDQCFLLASTETKVQMPANFTVFDLSLNDKGETIIANGLSQNTSA